MLKLIKKLFASEPEIVEQTLSFAELKDWLETKKQSAEEQVTIVLGKDTHVLESIKEEGPKRLAELQAAEVQNKNIPPKAFTFLEGNMSAFVKTFTNFYDTLPNTIEWTSPSARQQLNEQLDQLSADTKRNIRVINEFFAQKLRAVTNTIVDIKKVLQKVEHTAKMTKLTEINNCLDVWQSITNQEKQKETAASDLKKVEQNVQQKKQDVLDLQERIDGLRKSDAYGAFQRHSKLLQETQDKELAAKQEALNYFSGLDKALKKFSKLAMNHADFVEKYADKPADALADDTDLVVVKILVDLQQAIEKKSISLDEKKREKTLQKINSITEGDLADLQKNMKELQQQKETQLEQLHGLSIAGEIKKAEDQLHDAKKEADAAQSRFEKQQREIEGIDTEKSKKELVERINSNLSAQLILSN